MNYLVSSNLEIVCRWQKLVMVCNVAERQGDWSQGHSQAVIDRLEAILQRRWWE